MHIAILNFQLKNTTPDQFAKQCDELAPALAKIPGLISKVWLADATGNTYGGVYTWKDRAAFQAFLQSDLAKVAFDNPSVVDVTMRDYAVLEGPTKITRGLVA
jgi:heme-degrading monooxygenase HmoA